MKKIYTLLALCFFSRNAFGSENVVVQPMVHVKPLAEWNWDSRIHLGDRDFFVSLDILKTVEGRVVSKDTIEGVSLVVAYAGEMYLKYLLNRKFQGIFIPDNLKLLVQRDVQRDVEHLFKHDYSLPHVQSCLPEYLDPQHPEYSELKKNQFNYYSNAILCSIDEKAREEWEQFCREDEEEERQERKREEAENVRLSNS